MLSFFETMEKFNFDAEVGSLPYNINPELYMTLRGKNRVVL